MKAESEYTYGAYANGHQIVYEWGGHRWVYSDDGEEYIESSPRPCARCGKSPTDDGHDWCIQNLPGVKYACCGHGDIEHAYVMLDNGSTKYGLQATSYMRSLGADPWRVYEKQ